ncbi:MAG TPA: YncE family protein, partial [Patescibacteria group bacterium]|nr:YncE family protein [Patescibacteria group bacterium]
MKPRRIAAWLSWAAVFATACALGHHFGGQAHIRRKLGQTPLAKASCLNCHFNSIESLPWAKSRPHHDSPAGMAISPDGKTMFVALDDRDEVVQIDVQSRQVLQRVKVSGTPYGLVLDPMGKSLFITCKSQDRVQVCDATTLNESGSLSTGMGPTGLAYCPTTAGGR